MTRVDVEQQLSAAKNLHRDAIDALMAAEALVEKTPTIASVEAVSQAKARRAEAEETVDRLMLAQAAAEVEDKRVADLAKVDKYEAALPERLASLKKNVDSFVKAMRSVRDFGRKCEAEFEAFSEVTYEQVDNVGFAGGFKRLAWAAKWLPLLLNGDRVSAPTYYENELNELTASMEEMSRRAKNYAARRREILLHPAPKAVPRSMGPPLPATGPIPDILVTKLGFPEEVPSGGAFFVPGAGHSAMSKGK